MPYELRLNDQKNQNANDGTYEQEMKRKEKAVLTLLIFFSCLFFFILVYVVMFLFVCSPGKEIYVLKN